MPEKPAAAPPGIIGSDLKENGKLYSEAEIAAIRANLQSSPDGRYSKRKLFPERQPEEYKNLYSVIKEGNTLYGIYKGVTQEKHIGKGGFGTAKFAQNLNTGEWCVLKTAKQQPNISVQQVASNELACLKKLDMTSSMEPHRWQTRTGLSYQFLMKYVPGVSLRSLMQTKGQQPWLDIARATVAAVKACHEKGIIHCDIKPDNMIWNPETRTVTLIDFGNAREKTQDTKLVPAIITQGGYAAPEIGNAIQSASTSLIPVNTYTESSDAFALAKTLQFFLGFSNEAIQIVPRLPGQSIPKSPKQVNQINLGAEIKTTIEDFLGKMTAKNPSERPTMADAVKFFKNPAASPKDEIRSDEFISSTPPEVTIVTESEPAKLSIWQRIKQIFGFKAATENPRVMPRVERVAPTSEKKCSASSAQASRIFGKKIAPHWRFELSQKKNPVRSTELPKPSQPAAQQIDTIRPLGSNSQNPGASKNNRPK